MKEKKNKKVNKKKRDYPKWQFIFNITSMAFLLLLIIYIGGRSIYYYSKLNQKAKVEAHTLATIIKKNNTVVDNGDGLYRLNNEYVFKGREVNNYVKYSNRLWRVVRINDDGSVQLVADDNQTILVWGDNIEYTKSNVYKWLNKQKDIEHSGEFYNTLNKPEHYLDKTAWCEGKVKNNKIDCKKTNTKDYVALLTTSDYVEAKGVGSYLNDGTYSWLLGLDSEGENIYLSKTGTISPASNYEGYGVKPLITVKANIDVLDGNGTHDMPYIIEKEKEVNYINRYVKLGNDLWRVYEENDNILRLVLNNYLQMYNKDYELGYSNSTTDFDVEDRNNIAYFLNNKYLNSLPYKESLDACTFYTGEMSDETGYDYINIYSSQINVKVGLMNMLDLKLNQELSDYYLMNKTSSLGDMALIHNTDGKLIEDVTKQKRKIVPTVCLTKAKIVNGNGTIETPYVLE